MKYTLIYLSLALYSVYMLNWFKTTWNFAHPLSKFSSEYLAHPVNKLTEPLNPVCRLGNLLSWVLALGLILRGLSLDSIINKFDRLYIVFLVLTFVLSLLNFNVIVYLLPILIYELIVNKNLTIYFSNT
jgi:hypothetical protein